MQEISTDIAAGGAEFTYEQSDSENSGSEMKNSPKNFEEICEGLELDLADLSDLGAVMSTVLGGGRIEEAPDANGYVRLTGTEVQAIHWAGLQVASRIRALFEGFVDDYAAAVKIYGRSRLSAAQADEAASLEPA
jgi:hypothetical protein